MLTLDSIKEKLIGGGGRTANVKKNALGGMVVKGVSLLISLLLVPLTLDYVSSEVYGIWLTLSSIMIWLNFFDVGFTLGLKNKLAEAIANNDWAKGKSLVSTTYLLMISIFVPLAIILELIIPVLNWSSLLNVSDAYNEEITDAVAIMAFCFCLHMIVYVFGAVVAAHQKTALSSSFAVIGQCLSLILIWILTKTVAPSLPLLALVLSVSPLAIMFVASVWLFKHDFSKVSPSISSVNFNYIKELFSLGYKFFILQIKIIVYYQLTNILLLRVATPDDVTQYNISYKYLSMATMIVSMIITPIWPAFTDAYTKGDYVWMKSIYKRLIQLWSLSIVGLFIMFLLSPLFYKIWIGDSVSISWEMNVVVCLYVALMSWTQIHLMMINGIGKIYLQVIVAIIGCIAFVPVTYSLGLVWGAIGVILGLIIINSFDALFMTTQLRKILQNKVAGIWNK